MATSLRDARQTPTAVRRVSEKDVVLHKPVDGAVSLFAVFTEFKQRFSGHKHTHSRGGQTKTAVILVVSKLFQKTNFLATFRA